MGFVDSEVKFAVEEHVPRLLLCHRMIFCASSGMSLAPPFRQIIRSHWQETNAYTSIDFGERDLIVVSLRR